jgi:hypothetical protein
MKYRNPMRCVGYGQVEQCEQMYIKKYITLKFQGRNYEASLHKRPRYGALSAPRISPGLCGALSVAQALLEIPVSLLIKDCPPLAPLSIGLALPASGRPPVSLLIIDLLAVLPLFIALVSPAVCSPSVSLLIKDFPTMKLPLATLSSPTGNSAPDSVLVKDVLPLAPPLVVLMSLLNGSEIGLSFSCKSSWILPESNIHIC